LPKAPASATVVLECDDAVRDLNRRFRGQDKPTNVLSFPSPPPFPGTGHDHALGDVVIACETLLREAAELSILPAHHLQHLVVHGLLHLTGLDHATDAEALLMETLETDILASLRIPDPYAGTDPATTARPATTQPPRRR
jgi:probable rRNA maturation factor